ncbi:MAG: TlpA family protein disulfide reductase [Bacteroidetes bacterium]|nr:TlpA family protein disulfide reductase [Bacteroidota bacterium]
MQKIFLLFLLYPFPVFSQKEDSVIIWQKNHYQDTLAPHFDLTDVHGIRWNSDSLRGKMVVLNFWSVHCPGCYTEMPELNKIPSEFSADSIVFISVVFENNSFADSAIAAHQFNYHLVEGGVPVHGDFYNNCYPTHIIIDQQGIIRYNVCGVLNEKILVTEIRRSSAK